MSAIRPPITISGHGEASHHTRPAASSTPQLLITSLREHSHVLDMFTSWWRNRVSSLRHTRLAINASPPNTSISVELGGMPLCILKTTFTAIPTPSARITTPFSIAAPAFHLSDRASA